MKRTIVFVSDCADVAYSELRGVVISQLKMINSDVEVDIEPLASVKPFSIINGNFVLRLLSEVYPENTIFSVVLNPIKERPARLIGTTKKKKFYFMGANTGVFEWFFRDFEIDELYELHDPGFLPFGGKYVHAPVIAKMASGQQLNLIGKKFDVNNLTRLDIPNGTIVHIDNFGVMKFTDTLVGLNEGDKVTVEVKGQFLSAVYANRMMSRDTGEWVVYPGSSLGLPELGKVRQDGAREIGAEVGDVVRITV
ncbi:MAG: SAM-dependent chlorinase/fluorinase [Chlamydiota bacterium]|nr:SAM-dependent chlorinase/fluorinase [Chlamydiota bacterium]